MQLTWRNGLTADEVSEIRQLLSEAEESDGVAPVGEHVFRRLRSHTSVVQQIEPVQADAGGSEHFVVRADGGMLAGYAHLDTSGAQLVAELAVRPENRRLGAGVMLVRALLERAEVSSDEATAPNMDTASLKIWAHGDHPAAAALARRFGFTRARELWRMVREPAGLPEFVEPTGVTFRSFTPGVDEEAVIEVNGRAFASHPEQGALTVDDLRERETEGWFDRRGLILAHSDRLLGFHWTKVHPDGTGEVYVLGVDPDAQGSGLGKALTLVGLRHLADVGAPRVMLYVEGDNPAAIAVYRRLGFERVDIDVQYSH